MNKKPDSMDPAFPRPQPSRGVYILLFALAINVLSMVFYVTYNAKLMSVTHAPLADAAMQIELEATTAHLWFEEIIGGDKTANMDNVRASINAAQWYADAMLEGGTNERGTFIPLDDEELRDEIKEVKAAISEFKKLTEHRLILESTAGIGSEIDQEYAAIFERFITQADEVETMLQSKIAARMQSFDNSRYLLMCVTVGLFLWAAFALRKYERDRAEAVSNFLQTRRLAETNERRFSTTMRSMGDAVIMCDADECVTYLNPMAVKLTGWSAEEALGKQFTEAFRVIDEETREPLENPLGRVLGENTVVRPEAHTALFTKDGAVLPIASSLAPILDNEDKPFGAVAVFRDITDRKRAEEELRARERQLAESQTVASLGSWEWDLGANEVIWSDELHRLFCISREKFESRYESYLDFVHPDDKEEADKLVWAAIEAGEDFRFDARIVRPDGSTWVMDSIGKVMARDESGKPLSYAGTAQDITERKRSEEEKKNLEAQLQHAQKLESLGVLAGGIAHDFNNLLTSILGNADLALLNLSQVSPARGNLSEIIQASTRAAELCNQMLAYSGKGKFVVEPINLDELVEEMAHLLQISISKKTTLKFNFADNLPAVEADATQLRQIIMNLITNASEAIGEKNGVI